MGLNKLVLSNSEWNIPSRYENLEALGSGAFGLVCSAYDKVLKKPVAIKKLAMAFATSEHSKRTFREIKLLKHVKHFNIIVLLNLFAKGEKSSDLNDIYLVSNLSGRNLNDIIKSKEFADDHIVFYTYQILRGLKYLHSANIIHRDLKPSNITVSPDSELKLIDFGLSRNETDDAMTAYVVSRWYRAPEIILQPRFYTKLIDLWSLGCILAEMYLKDPIFPAKSPFDLLHLIMEVTGYPSEKYQSELDPTSLILFREKKNNKKVNFSEHFKINSPDAIDLLENLLTLDPSERFDCEKAIKHRYVRKYHDEEDEPKSEPFNELNDTANYTIQEWKRLVFDEIKNFKEPDQTTLAIAYKNEYN